MGACATKPDADPVAAMREACTFAAGAKAQETLGLDEAKRKAIPLKHIIVVMKENRSFDHLFGQLAKAGQPDVEGAPDGFSNQAADGAPVARFHQTSSCFHADPGHQWDEMHLQSNGGKMDGFVKSAAKSTGDPSGKDGRFVMGYYDANDLPFYYFLANTYAIADHHFPSILSGTWPNRDFLLFATNDGVKFTGDGFPKGPSILDEMTAAGVSWMAYGDGAPFEFTTGWLPGHAGSAKMADFMAALADGSLPAVSFVDARADVEDEHPPGDVQVGEAWTRSVYQALTASPLWSSTALVLTYDEAGGFHDHVPPPTNGCVPTPADAAATELGIRVPLIMISPYARPHYVSKARHEHTSITRLIETVFDLPAITARDANSDALLDMFDFGCAPSQPLPAAPAAGTGACVKGTGGAGGAAGAGGGAGAGGSGGVGGKAAECAMKATKADCRACCDADLPLAKVKLDLGMLTSCGCTAGATCATECASSCPSGPTNAACSACLQMATTTNAACAASALSSCVAESDCAPGIACAGSCAPLP
jgi:phospholipase C